MGPPGESWTISATKEQNAPKAVVPFLKVLISRRMITAWNLKQFLLMKNQGMYYFFFFSGEQGHFICHFTTQANMNIRCFSVHILSCFRQWELLFLLWNVCWNTVLTDLKKYYAIWYKRSQVLKESNEHHKLHERGVAESSNWAGSAEPVILSSVHHVVLHGENTAGEPRLFWQFQ